MTTDLVAKVLEAERITGRKATGLCSAHRYSTDPACRTCYPLELPTAETSPCTCTTDAEIGLCEKPCPRDAKYRHLSSNTMSMEDAADYLDHYAGDRPGRHQASLLKIAALCRRVSETPAFQPDELKAALVWLLKWNNSAMDLEECRDGGRGHAPEAIADTVDRICRETWPPMVTGPRGENVHTPPVCTLEKTSACIYCEKPLSRPTKDGMCFQCRHGMGASEKASCCQIAADSNGEWHEIDCARLRIAERRAAKTK